MSEAALDLMWALVIESGDRWGDVAADFQKDDAEAVHSPDGPNLHFITRPRGGSKSTDIAAIALSWLVMDAPPMANGHIVASNSEQAAIVIDAAAGLVARTPELQGILVIENERIRGPNGSWVRVLPQSASGSWGLRDAHLLICDEFCQWDETRGAKRVWTAIRSTVQKVPGCRLVVLSSAGEPSHWSAPIFEQAKTDPLWRVSEAPGPVPWQRPEDIEGLRRALSPSEFDRLVLNKWAESEDRAISEEDLDRALQPAWRSGTAPAGLTGGGWRIREPQPGERYILTVDVGIKNDATVLCLSHKERMVLGDSRSPHRVVIDHLDRWQGSKRHHVQIEKVIDRIKELHLEYNKAKVHADPYQFVGGIQELQKSGVRSEEFTFGTVSVGRLATALVQAFHNSQIHIPDSDDLKTELLTVRLRESSPGVTRLSHDRDKHDDQAVAIGMATEILLGLDGWGAGSAWLEAYKNSLGSIKEAGFIPKEHSSGVLLSRGTRGDYGDRPQKVCNEPRFFGSEMLCAHCGISPSLHPRKKSR